MADFLVGIDLGTTRVKAGLVRSDFSLMSVESAPTPWRATHDGPVVDVAELGTLAIDVAGRCATAAVNDNDRIVGIGVTGMAETGALLDEAGDPLAPGYAWHHSVGDAERVQDALGRDTFMRRTGHGCDLAPSIIKLDHLRNGGHVFSPGQRWLNLPEYLTWRLTGQAACEFSLSGRTGLFDLIGRRWWGDALDFLGAGEWLMPGEPVAAGVAVGAIGDNLPASLRGAVVTTAGHDHPVAALAVDQFHPGSLCLSLGTSEAQVRVVAPTLSHDAVLELARLGVTVDWHPLGDRWYVLGTLPTGLTLERLARLVGCASTSERLRLSREAMQAPPPIGAELSDVTLDGFSVVGITSGDDRASLWRRAVEQLLDRSAEASDAVSAILGPPTSQVVLGGWTHDPLIRRERERMGQRPLHGTPDEPGIVGAAMLAAKAAGMPHPLDDDASARHPFEESTHQGEAKS